MTSDLNPVLVKIILSVSDNYPQVYYDAQHFCVMSILPHEANNCYSYFAFSWTWLAAVVSDHVTTGHMKKLERMFDLVDLDICNSSVPHMDQCCNGFRAGKQLLHSCLH